jgi:hypothetical protein
MTNKPALDRSRRIKTHCENAFTILQKYINLTLSVSLQREFKSMQIHVSEACFLLQTDEPISYPCTFVHAGAVRRPSLQGPAPIALKLLQEAHFITSFKGEIYRYANRSIVLLLIKQGSVFQVLFLNPHGKHAQFNMACTATSQQCT